MTLRPPKRKPPGSGSRFSKMKRPRRALARSVSSRVIWSHGCATFKLWLRAHVEPLALTHTSSAARRASAPPSAFNPASTVWYALRYESDVADFGVCRASAAADGARHSASASNSLLCIRNILPSDRILDVGVPANACAVEYDTAEEKI